MKDLDNDDREISIIFEVKCNSPISMQSGNSVIDRVNDYISTCIECINGSMRGYGDNEMTIDIKSANILQFNESTEEDEEIKIDLDDLDLLA